MKKIIAGILAGIAITFAVPASAATIQKVPPYRALPTWIAYFHAQPRDEKLVGLKNHHRRCIVLITQAKIRTGEMICADGQTFLWTLYDATR